MAARRDGARKLLENLPVPCALLTAEGCIEAINQSWSNQIAPGSLFDTVGSSFVERIGRVSASARLAAGVREVLSGKASSFDYEIASGGEGARWFRVLATRRAGEGAMVVLVDITERYRTEEALRESEFRLRRMVESVVDYAIFTLDPKGVVTTWNRGAERIYGYNGDEMMGRHFEVLFTPEDRDAGRPGHDLRIAAEAGRCESEGWRCRKDGSRFWASTVSTALRDAEDRLHGFSKVVRDLTERRRTEVTLRDNQARLLGIIESAMDAIITVDESQRIMVFNRAAERIFGVPAAEAIGGPLDRFIPARYRNDHSGHIRKFGTTGVTTRAMGRLGTLSGLRADGSEFPIEASISQAMVGDKRFFTVILRDISERKKLEEQLLQSQKMEGIGRLAGGVAHDFNNLLTVIFGYIAQAATRLEPGHPARADLGQAQEAADRAATLTKQLLAFARKQIVTPRVLDVASTVHGVEQMLHRLIGEDLTLRVIASPDTGQVMADPGQLEQVIVNLAVNARDAMPTGGTLTIETSNVELDEAYCETRVGAAPGEHVVIAVTDSGVGMPPEVLARLFEPFFTTKGPGKGTGLGLATCHGIIRQSGGHITVYSELGQGTSVKVFLPRIVAGVRPERKAAKASPTVGGRETVLLVEDNAMVRDLVAQGLRAAGYTVLEAPNGPAAIAMAGRGELKVDLMVTDVVMPEMNGVRLAEILLRVLPNLVVLYTSGYTEETVVRHGVETEGMAFIAKPFSIDALLAKVRLVLDSYTSEGPRA